MIGGAALLNGSRVLRLSSTSSLSLINFPSFEIRLKFQLLTITRKFKRHLSFESGTAQDRVKQLITISD